MSYEHDVTHRVTTTTPDLALASTRQTVLVPRPNRGHSDAQSMPFRFVRRDGVQSKLLTKKSAAAYGTPFKGKRLRLRAARRSHTVATACLPGQHRPMSGTESLAWGLRVPGRLRGLTSLPSARA